MGRFLPVVAMYFAAISFSIVSQSTHAAASLSASEKASFARTVPEIARVDASASHVAQTLSGTKKGYLVLFKPGSRAYPPLGTANLTEKTESVSTAVRPARANFGASKQEILQSVRLEPKHPIDRYGELPLTYIEVSSADELNRLLSLPDVATIHENRVHQHHAIYSPPLISLPSVAAFGQNFLVSNLGLGTSVAVLDSGVKYLGDAEKNLAFGSCTAQGQPATCKVAYAQDFAANDNALDSPSGHGTNVAAIIAAIAPATKILALDVFNGTYAEDADILAAMSWVIEQQRTQPTFYNIVAMNLSLGRNDPQVQQTETGPFKVAIDLALSYRIATIVAAGNNACTPACSPGLSTPANVKGAISVGSVYSSGNFAGESCYAGGLGVVGKPVCSSNFADYLTILAPGKEITAAGYTFDGTSQAAPHVAAAYAILRSTFPTESHDALVARLTQLSNVSMISDDRVLPTPKKFPRLNLWESMGACTYTADSPSISLFSGAVRKTFNVRTNHDYCPFAASKPAADAWLSIVSVTQNAIDKTRWTIVYDVATNMTGMNRDSSINFLTVSGVVATASQTVPLTGIAITQRQSPGDQRIISTVKGLAFGDDQDTGSKSTPLNIVIGNIAVVVATGLPNQDSLNITAIDVVKPDNSPCLDFSATALCVGQDIAPAATCAIGTAFTPLTIGTPVTCKLRITSNDPVTGSLYIDLVGNSKDPVGGKLSVFGPVLGEGNVNIAQRLRDALALTDPLPNGSIVVAGSALSMGAPTGQGFLSKYDSSGAGDTSFAGGGAGQTPNLFLGPPYRTTDMQFVRRDNKDPYNIVVFGTSVNSVSGSDKKPFVARYLLNGGLDPTPGFGVNGVVQPSIFGTGAQDNHLQYAAVGTDDRLYIKFNCTIVRLFASGVIDSSYAGGTGAAAVHNCVDTDTTPFVVLSDHSILYATTSVADNGEQGIGVSRLNPDGTPDTTFGKTGLFDMSGTANGRVVPSATKAYASDLTVLPDGKILAVGPLWLNYATGPNKYSAYAVRFTADGQEDPGFGIGGKIELAPDTAPSYPGVLRALSTEQFAVLRTAPPAGVANPLAGSFDVYVWRTNGQPENGFNGGTLALPTPGKATSTRGDGVAMSLTKDRILVVYPSGLVEFNGPLLTGSSASGLGGRASTTESNVDPSTYFTNASLSPLTLFPAGMPTQLVIEPLDTLLQPTSEFGNIRHNCPAMLGPQANCQISYTVSQAVTGTRTAIFRLTTGTMPPQVFLLLVSVTVVANTSYPLTVSRGGSGSGRVTSSPSGIDCGSLCQIKIASTAASKTVLLTAIEDTGSDFANWTGDCAAVSARNCTVNVLAARNVTANFTIQSTSIPANNDFANRRQLAGSVVREPVLAPIPANQIRIYNVGASKEPTEPNHGGNAGGKSLWWTWTAPISGRVTIDTKGSTFDTLLGIYTGEVLATLVPVVPVIPGQGDDGEFYSSKVTFIATRGEKYQIAVDGFRGATGEVALNIRQPIYAYVPSNTTNALYVFDTVTDTPTSLPALVSTLTINGNSKHEGIAVGPAGDKAYVTNFDTNSISIVDVANNTKVDASVGVGPRGIAVNPRGNRIYVANSNGNSVTVLDTSTSLPIVDVALGAMSTPFGVAVNPEGTRVYVTLSGYNMIAIIDAATNTFSGYLTVGAGPRGIVLSADGTRAYVANYTDGSVTIIDTTNHTVIDTIAMVGTHPHGIAINAAGSRVYVANIDSDSIAVIDTATRSVSITIAVGTNSQ